MLDENLENQNTLNTIEEEDQSREDQELLDSHAINNANCNAYEEDDKEENTNYQFPDTQIKIDLSGPKYVDVKFTIYNFVIEI